MGNQQGSPSSRNKQFLRDVNLPGKIPERLPEKENTDTLSDTTNKEGSSVDVQSDNLDGQRETVLIGSSLGLPGEKCTQSIEKAAKEYIPSSVGETVNHIRCDAKKEVELEHKDDHADESSQVENDVPSYECNQTVNTEHVLSDHQTLLSISPHIETEECIREMLGVSDAENSTSGRFSMEHKTVIEQVDSKSVSEHTRNVFRVDSDKGAGSVEALSMEFINGNPGSQKNNNGLNSEPNQGADADDENSDDEKSDVDDEPNTAPVSPLSPNKKFSEEQEMGRITCETETGPSLPEIPLVATVGVVKMSVLSYECNQTVNSEHVLSDHQTLSISPQIETEECIREVLGVSDAENATSGRFSMEHKTITEQVDSKSVSEHTRNVFRVDSDKGAGSVEALSMEFINGDPGSQKDNNGLNSEPNQRADANADDKNSDDDDVDDGPNTTPVSPLSPNTKFSEEQEMGKITCETETGPSLPEIPLVATVGVVKMSVPSYECNQTFNTEHVLSDHQTLLSISPQIETEESIREMLGVSDAENATFGRFSMEHKTVTEQVDSKSVSEHTRNVFRVDSDKGAGSVEAFSTEFINGDPGSQKDNNGLNSEPNQGADADDENSDDEDDVDDDEPNTAPVSPLSPNTKFSEEQEMGKITCETKTGPSLPEIPLVATVGEVKMSVDSSKLMSQHHEAGVYKRKCTFVGDDNRTQCHSDQNGHLSGNGMTYGIYSNVMFLPDKSKGAAPKRYGPKKLGATMPAMEDVDGECDEPPSEVSELDSLKTDPHVYDISNSSFVLKDEPPFQGKHGSDLCIKPASSLTAHEHDSSEECEANMHNHGDYRNTASFPTFGKNCKFNIDWNILKSKQGQFAKNLKSCCSNIAEDNRISLEFSLPFYHGKIEIGGEMTTFNFSEPLSKTERSLSSSIGSHPEVIENNLDISSDEEMCEPEKVSVHYETVDTCSIKPDLKKCFQDLSTYQTLQNHVHDQFEPGTGLKTAFDEINAVCSKPPSKQVEVGNVNDKETHDEAENDALEMATSKLFKDANGLSEVGVNKLTNSQAFVLDTYGSETATSNNNSNVDIDSTTTSLNTSSSSFSNGNLERNGRLKAAPKNNTHTLSVSESDIPALAEIQGNKDGNDRQISMGQCDIERNSVEKTEGKDVDRDTESAIAYEDERTSRLEKSNLLNGNQDKSHVDFKDQQGDDDSSSHDKSGETKNDIDLSGSDDHGMNTYTSIFKRKQTNKDQDNRLVKIDSDDEDNIRVPQAQMQDDSHNSIREPSNKIPGFPDDIMSTSDESLKIDEIRKRQRNRRMERKMAKLLHESVDTETLERTERHRPRDGPSNKGRIVNKNQHRGVASGEDDNHEEANALGGLSQITDDSRSMFEIGFTLEPNEFHGQLERKMTFRRYRDVVKSERREPTKLRHPDGTKRRPVNKNISGPKRVSRLQSSDTVNVEEDKTNRDDEPAFFDTEEDFSDESSVMSNSDVEKEEGPLAELDEANWDAVFKLETVKSRRTIETPAQYRCTVLCIDISESMQGDPWLQVKDALQVFLKGIEDVKSRFGTAELVSMVTFGHETKMALTPTTDYSQVMTTFDRLEVRGNTPLQPGLFLALFPVIVTANNRHDYNAYGQKVRHRVILFTDCHPTPYKVLSDNDSVTESQSTVAVKEVVERMKNLNSQGLRNIMNIHCVPIGENPNLVLMEVIAKKSGGQIVPLTDIERLSTSTHNYLKALHITRHILDCGTDRLDEKLLTSIITTLFPDVGTEDMVQIKSEIRFEFKKNKRQNKDKPKTFSGMEDDAGAKDTDSDEDSDEETNSNGNEHDSFTEVEGMPAIGTRVKRGPDFDPDEIVVVSERGTITGHSVRKKKCVFVHWDCGIKTYCHYGEKNKYDVVLDDAAHIPSKIKDKIKVGHKVRRGPNWQYGNQDGGSDKLGTVYDVEDNGVKVQVRWENGNTGHYRYNYDGAYDVLISCQNDPFDVQRYTHEMNRRNLAKLRGIDINSAVHYRHEKLDIDLSESLIGLDLDKPKKGQGRTNKNAVCYQNMNHVDYASTGAIPKKIKVPFKYS